MFRLNSIVNAVAGITRIFAFLLLVPVPFALLLEPWNTDLGGFKVPRNALVFLGSAAAAFIAWFPLRWFTREVEKDGLQEREAYLSVAVGWLFLVVLGMVPFLLSREIPNLFDAFFESMSALTATGATIINRPLEDIAPSIHVWRAGMQYLGGMGIIVLSVALLARLTHGGAMLVAAEMSGPGVQRLRPRLAETAKTLWKIYGVFSAVCFVAYALAMRFHARLPTGEALFDALIHTFTTLSTAGFSNHSTSLAFYDSWVVEAIAIFFVLIAGTSFALHAAWMSGDWKRVWRDVEFRMFIGLWFFFSLFITGVLWHAGGELFGSLRDATFTVASIGTSLGYATADYDDWPGVAKLILILMMFTGASAGSTSGGIKLLRVLILWKIVSRQMKKLQHPRAVIPVRVRRKVVPEESLMNVTAFLFTFLSIWLAGAAFLIWHDPALDTFDGAVAAASAMGNTGPAMGVVGPTDNFGLLQPASKFVLSLLMWIGRLEVFTAVLVFLPSAWSRG